MNPAFVHYADRANSEGHTLSLNYACSLNRSTWAETQQTSEVENTLALGPTG